MIGGAFLDEAYNRRMARALQILQNSRGATVGIDGASNALSKSISNVIIHTTITVFDEYVSSDLHRKTTPNVVAKVKDTVNRVSDLVGYSPDSFVSDNCKEM